MRKEKQEQLKHLIAGIITLIYGFDTFEAGDISSSAGYLTLAIIFLIVAGLHKWITDKFMKADVAFFLLEAATIVYSGWHYQAKGRPFLFYAMTAAAVFYFIFSVISLLSKEKIKHRSRRRKKRKRSSLFDEKRPDENIPAQ